MSWPSAKPDSFPAGSCESPPAIVRTYGLHRRRFVAQLCWHARRDSNPQPSVPKSACRAFDNRNVSDCCQERYAMSSTRTARILDHERWTKQGQNGAFMWSQKTAGDLLSLSGNSIVSVRSGDRVRERLLARLPRRLWVRPAEARFDHRCQLVGGAFKAAIALKDTVTVISKCLAHCRRDFRICGPPLKTLSGWTVQHRRPCAGIHRIGWSLRQGGPFSRKSFRGAYLLLRRSRGLRSSAVGSALLKPC